MEDRLMGAEFGASCARVCGRCDIIRDNPTTEELLKRAQDMIFQAAYLIGDDRRLIPICELRCCFRALRFFVIRCSPKQLHWIMVFCCKLMSRANMRPLLKLSSFLLQTPAH